VTLRIESVALLIAATLGCKSTTGPAYSPEIPTAWAGAVTNTYFPLVPGAVYTYISQTTAGRESVTVEVLAGTKVIQSVTGTTVHDRVYLNGMLIEDTQDWYAQDGAGNVWYLGEDTKELANGQVVSTEGTWEWGVHGALPGVIMWADPAAKLNTEYRQEFYRGQAEDWAEVVALGQTVTVPYGTFTGCITTEDWSGLEPAVRELKSYCPGLGLTLEVVAGSGEREELVGRTTP